jgi:hypothetical protein
VKNVACFNGDGDILAAIAAPAIAPAPIAAIGVMARFPGVLGLDATDPDLEKSGLTILNGAFGSGSMNGLFWSVSTGYAIPASDETDRRCGEGAGNIGVPEAETPAVLL